MHQEKKIIVLSILTAVVVLMNACSNSFVLKNGLATNSAVSSSHNSQTTSNPPATAPPSTTATPVASSPPSATPIPTPTPPGSNAKLIFTDDFNTLSLFNSITGQGNWATTGVSGKATQGTPGWGDEFDIDPGTNTLGINPFRVANGILTIVTDVAPANIQSQIAGKHYVAGALRSWNVTLGYGYYEMRAQLPKGNGNWPAFWLLPSDGAWPPEIDIFEVLGNNPTTLFTTVHSTLPIPNYSQMFADNHYSKGDGPNVGVDMSDGYHVYGVDYRADTLTWYFDGVAKFSVPTPADLQNRGVYIVIDNAIGGWGGNSPDGSSVFPSFYNIDYVRVYDSRPF
jgi:beta-glucanase (GH16 family)